MKQMEALAIVIAWIADGTRIREKRRRELLSTFCLQNQVHKSEQNWTTLKHGFTWIRAIIRNRRTMSQSISRYKKVCDEKDWTPIKKVVWKSRFEYVIHQDSWEAFDPRTYVPPPQIVQMVVQTYGHHVLPV